MLLNWIIAVCVGLLLMAVVYRAAFEPLGLQ